MFGVSIGWALLRKLWPFIAIAALCGVIFVQYQWVKNARLEKAAAEVALSAAVAVNERNEAEMARLEAERARAQAVADEAIAAAKARVAETNKLKEELRHAPGANDPAGDYFDALSRQLRGQP